jgi:hypothetical protein
VFVASLDKGIDLAIHTGGRGYFTLINTVEIMLNLTDPIDEGGLVVKKRLISFEAL